MKGLNDAHLAILARMASGTPLRRVPAGRVDAWKLGEDRVHGTRVNALIARDLVHSVRVTGERPGTVYRLTAQGEAVAHERES